MRLASAALVVSALTLPGQSAFGQAKALASTTWGPVVAMNVTTFGGSDADGASNRIAPGFGAEIQHTLGATAFFRSGLVFAMRGAKSNESGFEGTFKLNYLEVPAIFGYRFPTQGKVSPFVIAGGHFALLAGCSVHVDAGGGIGGSVACDHDQLQLNITDTDVAVLGGGGLNIASGANTISLDLRYALGLQSIAQDADTKNRGFSLAVGYMMPLGRK